MHSVPHLSVLKNILMFDYHNYLEARMCRSKPVGLIRAKDSTLYCTIDDVSLFKTRPANDEFVHVV